jgi:hypothetical protein
MRTTLWITLVGTGVLMSHAAMAQTAVLDTANLPPRKGVTDCTTSIRQTNQTRQQPTQGVKGSVASQGSATGAPTSSVGVADLTGGAGSGIGNYAAITNPTAGASTTTASASATPTVVAGFSNIGGINLSALSAVQGGGFNVGTALQVVKAGLSVAAALQGNNQTLTSAGALIGSINTSHGGWDQNSAGRVAQTASWNQVLQAANTTTQLRNMILMGKAQAAAATAAMMSATGASK